MTTPSPKPKHKIGWIPTPHKVVVYSEDFTEEIRKTLGDTAWKTKDGRIMSVTDMKPEHAINVLSFLIKRFGSVLSVKTILTSPLGQALINSSDNDNESTRIRQ